MDFKPLLQRKIQLYIEQNTSNDISKLALSKNPFPEFDFKKILNQIECRQKSKIKLSTWFCTKNIIYPSKISVEQTSSEIAANYKSKIISGKSIIDLSGGFGVDAYYFSKSFNNVVHCELDTELSDIVAHNFIQLNRTNIICQSGDSYEILKQSVQKYDWIYIDPSRRNDKKEKVFMLKDCLPNVPLLLDDYFRFSNKILIKTAPILDIKAGINELKYIKKIHIIAIENEVKELLWELEKEFDGKIKIITKNFTKTNLEVFDFYLENDAIADLSLPLRYLFEPNSSIMKSGGFAAVAQYYKLKKLHQNSHLYTSDDAQKFPGRVFEINQIIPYSKKGMKIWFENTTKNISIRNFPDTVEQIRKKWKIKDGGNDYCFFTTDKNDNKIVLICKKYNLPYET